MIRTPAAVGTPTSARAGAGASWQDGGGQDLDRAAVPALRIGIPVSPPTGRPYTVAGELAWPPFTRCRSSVQRLAVRAAELNSTSDQLT